MQVQGEDKPYDDINITPMLDLAYVLLVIFILMCTASVAGTKVNLPKASNTPAPLSKPKTKAITINNEGKMFLDTVPVTLQELETKLQQVKASTPDFPVVIRGDSLTHYQGVMDVLSEAKQKGIIRAHGCSCHSIEALRAAAKSPWVEVDLVRLNPIGSHMDADPQTVLAVVKEMKAAGKGVVGMKILGQGDMRDRQDEAIRFALSTGVLDAFTIGAESKAEQQDLMRRIAAA